MEPALRWLLDRAALHELMLDYFGGVDDRDFERVAGCFAPDVCAHYGPKEFFERGELVDFISGVRFFHTTLHCMGSQLIELDGDEARMASSAMLAHHARLEDGRPYELFNSSALYSDRLRRSDGRWLVYERGGDALRPAVDAPVPEPDSPALRWLVDRAQVRDLLAQWALGMDEHDAERLARCHAPGGPESQTSRPELGAPEAGRTTHFLGTPVIDVAEDGASVESCALVTSRGDTDDTDGECTRSIRFGDRIVRADGRFWLADRHVDARPGPAPAGPEAPQCDEPVVRELVDREVIRDRIARRAFDLDAASGFTTNHLVGNQEVRIAHDVAQVRSYVYATRRDGADESHWGRGPLHWFDRLERRGGAWHFAEHRDVDLMSR